LKIIKPENTKYVIGSNPLFSVNDVRIDLLERWKDRIIIAVDWQSDHNSDQYFVTDLGEFTYGESDRRTAASYEAVEVLSRLFQKKLLLRKDIISGLKGMYSAPIKSGVFPGKYISFEIKKDSKKNIDIGDRIGVINRILVTPYIVPEQENKPKSAIYVLKENGH
jgi:hypothetical protein